MQPDQSFGERLAAMRKAAGLSQRQLARQTGLSQRMIAYYETRDPLPPGHVLTLLSEALGASVDELVGAKKLKPSAARRAHPRLWQRFQQIDKLPARERRELFAVIDAFLDRNRLNQLAKAS